ncbi:hypothetical protein EYS09_26190 [Streptomyces kasugaensis]|uniref:Terminase n=1 Tax=Streptomyces kasugaensis TaxID=1946 RepID=A0A4Q9HPF0_STRKA|nr:hypothetical protein [Streptomyces kasugaensis]TBO56767.1 hypothetical protein EYS09_26190 [Streptomyces kasugaensis]
MATQQPDLRHITRQIQELVHAGDVQALQQIRDQLKNEADRHAVGRRAARYASDPVGWVEERLDQVVWSRQGQVLESVRDHRRTAVRSGHGVGKSWTAALAACWWLDVHTPGTAFVVSTAPTFAQVRAILWRYIRRHHKAAGLPGRVNQTEWLIGDELVGYGRKPADQDESGFQGIHARYVLVIIDEACGVPEQLWTAADALTTGPDCRILAIGNPDNPASHFRKVCASGSSWNVMGISAFDSPNLTGEDVPEEMALALVGEAWVEEKRVEWGEDNPLYKSKVLGEFSDDSPKQIVRASDIAACRIAPDEPPAAEMLLPVELGVDVGGGSDETVIRERRGHRAGREWRARTDRPERIAPMVLAAIRETGATAVKVDSIGVGFGVIGELRNAQQRGEHQAAIRGINVAAAASRPDKYINLRAELWWSLGRNMSAEHSWDLSEMENADATIAQLLEPRWDLDPRGRIRVEKKEEVIKRLGRSPDNADALLLAFAHGQAADAISSPAGVSLAQVGHARPGGLGAISLGRSGYGR